MRVLAFIPLAALLAACVATPRMDDPRAAAMIAMDGPQHYADRNVVRELAVNCARYRYDEELATAMTQERIRQGRQTLIQVQGATDLETDLQRRSLAARYGSADYRNLDPCAVLDDETARQTPRSVLVVRRG